MSELLEPSTARLATEWQRWLAGVRHDSPLRPLIEESWQRCRAAGLDPEHVPMRRVPADELALRLERNADLIAIARPHLEWISAIVGDRTHVVYIVDADGIVLASVGNDAALREEAGLEPGYDWSELRMGTNGAGTALTARAPVAVIAEEHYATDFRGCTCTAAPLLSANGELLGAVDITTHNEPGAPERLALVAYAASTIERDFFKEQALAQAVAAQDEVEQRLREESQIRFQARLLDAVEQAVIATDKEGRIVYWNRFAEKLYGWSASEALGRDVLEVTPAADVRASAAEIFSRLAAGESWSGEFMVTRKDGSDFLAHVTNSPVQDAAGRLIGVVGLSGDISERRRTEDALRASEERLRAAVAEREEIVAIVSHDLRNPLNTVMMASSLMLESSLAQEKKEAQLALIRRAVQQMGHLIEDLLDVTRIGTGQLAVEPAPCDPAELLGDAFNLHAPIAAAQSKRLDLAPAEDVPAVLADRERALQIFSNLIGNALTFTPPDGVITLRATRMDGDVCFSVSDSGAGIPAEDLPRIFDRFWKAHRTERKGAGLGLSIVKGIVEAHGGRIWAESEPGRGSTFYFTLPRARIE